MDVASGGARLVYEDPSLNLRVYTAPLDEARRFMCTANGTCAAVATQCFIYRVSYKRACMLLPMCATHYSLMLSHLGHGATALAEHKEVAMRIHRIERVMGASGYPYWPTDETDDEWE